MTQDYRLLSFAPTFTNVRQELMDIERVHTATDGALLAIHHATAVLSNPGQLVHRFHAGEWTAPIVMSAPPDSVMGFGDVNGRPILTIDTELFVARSDGATIRRPIPSEGNRDRGMLSVAAAGDEDIYVGSWVPTTGGTGGGMYRTSQTMELPQTEERPLNGITAHGWAVTAVAHDPARSDCIYFAAATNNVAKGRVGEICAGTGGSLFDDAGEEFFTLVAQGRSLLAIGNNHAHVLEGGKSTLTLPLPLASERRCGVEVASVGDYWAFPTGSRVHWKYLGAPKAH